MKIKEILEKFNLYEQETEINVDKIKRILDAAYIDYDVEEDEKITINTFKTMYNEYKYYSVMYDDHCIMLAGDYKNFCKDLSSQLAQCLPDDFDKFFNEEALYAEMLKDNYFVESTINVINKLDKEADLEYIPTDPDFATVDNIEYVIFVEK